MFNKNHLLKQKAIKLRKLGYSLRDVEARLGTPRSTLSGWFKSIKLTKSKKNALYKKWQLGLKKARIKAAKVNRQAKQDRINKIESLVTKLINNTQLAKKELEIFLAGLYLGDGFKIAETTALGSSNPKILKGFVCLLRHLYNIDQKKLRGAIYARADQKPDYLIKYWSRLLNIPKTQFHKTQIDRRTLAKKTIYGYKGVCTVYYYDVRIKRRLIVLSEQILGRVAQLV